MNPAETYILSKDEPWRSILLELQAIIKHTVPELEETYKWNLPFYTLGGKMFCFLNFRKKFVDIGFLWGTRLTSYQEHLMAGEGRKTLRSLRYHSMDNINYEVLTTLLLEHKTLIQEKLYRKKG